MPRIKDLQNYTGALNRADIFFAVDGNSFSRGMSLSGQQVHTLCKGIDGKNIELRSNSAHIQWRWEGDSTWANLIAVSSLKGEDGKELEIRIQSGYIQTRLTGGTWSNLIALDDLKGASAFDAWQSQPENFGKTYNDYIADLRQPATDAASTLDAYVQQKEQELTQLQQDTESARQDVITATTNANNAAGAAGSSVTAADNAVSAANQAAIDANTAKDTAEEAAGSANNAADAANTATTAAGSATQNAADATVKAEELNANPPKIQDGEWWVYNLITHAYINTGLPSRGSQGKPLVVLPNGNYGNWNESTGQYDDSGIVASAIVDIENIPVVFTEAATRETINSEETVPIIFGKLKKWFSDLGILAWKDKADYNTDIDNLPAIPEAQIQSDWSQTDNLQKDFVKNKPDLSVYAEKTELPDLTNVVRYDGQRNVDLTGDGDLIVDIDKVVKLKGGSDEIRALSSEAGGNMSIVDIPVGFNLRGKTIVFAPDDAPLIYSDSSVQLRFIASYTGGGYGSISVSGGDNLLIYIEDEFNHPNNIDVYSGFDGGWIQKTYTFPDDADFIVQSNELKNAVVFPEGGYSLSDAYVDGEYYSNIFKVGDTTHNTIIQSKSRPSWGGEKLAMLSDVSVKSNSSTATLGLTINPIIVTGLTAPKKGSFVVSFDCCLRSEASPTGGVGIAATNFELRVNDIRRKVFYNLFPTSPSNGTNTANFMCILQLNKDDVISFMARLTNSSSLPVSIISNSDIELSILG